MGRFRSILFLQAFLVAGWLTQFTVVSNDRFSTTSEVATTTETTTTTTVAATTTSRTTTTTSTTTTTTTRRCFDLEGFISPDDRGPEGCDGLSAADCETYGEDGKTQYFQKPAEYCCVCGGGYTTTTTTTTVDTTTTTLSCATVLNNQNIGYVGDGYCDSGESNHNTRSCNWDGGDCCEATCTSGRTYGCGVNGFDCRAPADEQVITTYVYRQCGSHQRRRSLLFWWYFSGESLR